MKIVYIDENGKICPVIDSICNADGTYSFVALRRRERLALQDVEFTETQIPGKCCPMPLLPITGANEGTT